MALSLNGTSGISGVDGSAGTPALQGSDTNTGISFGTDEVNINTGGTTRATVDSSGRVLVGTSTAQGLGKIQVEGDADGAKLYLRRNITNSAMTTSGQVVLGSIDFGNIDGAVGARIQANNDTDSGWANNDYPTRLVFSTTADSASSPTERMRITQEGNVRIGTTAALDVSVGTDDGFRFISPGTAEGIFQCSNNNNYVGYLRRRGTDGGVLQFFKNTTGVGSISVTGSATAYNTSSDYRLKENVTAVADGITRLQQLKPSRFNFIADPGKTVDGFLAHEVQTVVPEAIHGIKDEVDADGNPIYQGIDQSKLVPLLTAALQEAIAKIESLETRLTALEGGATQ